MKAGILKEQIELYKREEIINDFGEKKLEWKFYKKVRAAVKRTAGNRTIENKEIVFPANSEFIVRHYIDVDENMRIKYNNKFYRILSIDPNKYFNDKVIGTEKINE